MILLPCPICGAPPDVSQGLADLPDTAGYTACRTVFLDLEGERDVACPMHAESPNRWNALARRAERHVHHAR